MIVLLNPMFSHQVLNADSNYVFFSTLIRKFLEIDPDVSFLLPWPTNPEWQYYRDGFFDEPRVRRIPMRVAEAKRFNNVSFDARWYHQVFWSYAPDVTWNLNVETGHLLARLIGAYSQDAEPPVLNQHFYVLHPTTQQPMWGWEHFVWAQVVSSIVADRNLHPTRYCQGMLEDNFRDVGLASRIEEVRARSAVLPWGLVDVPRVKGILENAEKFDRPTVFYNHRLQGYKNYLQTFRILGDLWEERKRDFDVLVSFQAGDKANAIRRKFPFLKIVRNDSHDDYMASLARAHVNVTNSGHETFCISLLEAMSLGLACVAPKGVTFPEVLGADYPGMFSTVEEERAMLSQLLDDPQKAGRLGDSCRRRAWESFDLRKFAPAYLAEIRKTWEARPDPSKALKEKNRRILDALLAERRGTASRHDLREFTARANLAESQSVPPVRWARLLRCLGYESYLGKDEAYWIRKRRDRKGEGRGRR